jgi:sugar phosphate permease
MPDTTRIPVPGSIAVPESVVSRPTKTRWLVLLLISLMYMITYMDRTGISIAAPAMEREFGLSKTAIGVVFSVFLWAYAIGQIPGGCWCF